MIIQLDFNSEKSIYIQLYEQIILSISKGELKSGDKLPSVRAMAEEIGINLHTVKKTYDLLKAEGYILVDRRKGAMVSEFPVQLNLKAAIYEELDFLISKAYLNGIPEKELKDQMEDIYKKCKEGVQ